MNRCRNYQVNVGNVFQVDIYIPANNSHGSKHCRDCFSFNFKDKYYAKTFILNYMRLIVSVSSETLCSIYLIG